MERQIGFLFNQDADDVAIFDLRHCSLVRPLHYILIPHFVITCISVGGVRTETSVGIRQLIHSLDAVLSKLHVWNSGLATLGFKEWPIGNFCGFFEHLLGAEKRH